MFNSYAARLINVPAGSPLSQTLVPHFDRFCDPESLEYWPELVSILQEEQPRWFGLASQNAGMCSSAGRQPGE